MSDKSTSRLIEDVRTILSERGFNARIELIMAYHEVGARIREETGPGNEKITYLLQRVAEAVGRSERTLWYAVAFYDKFPDLNMLPEGKNLNWREICQRYLSPSSTSPESGREGGKTPSRLPSPKEYVQVVKTAKCVAHGDRDAEAHHFPTTRGAGAVDWHVIPLCRECHSAAHQSGKDWLWDNRRQVFGWFYSIMGRMK